MKTVRVRIAVYVTPSGEWTSAGWSSADDETKAGCVYDHSEGFEEADHGAVHWIEADVPVPEPPARQTIEGEVIS